MNPADLQHAYDEAVSVHGNIAVSREAFDTFVTERIEGDVTLSREQASDLLLACGCAAGDAAALAIFDETLLCQVPQFLSKLESNKSAQDEVTQLLRERLFVGKDGARPKIAEFGGKGRLASWLRVVAIRTALNAKGGKREVSLGDQADAAIANHDPELEYLRTRYKQQFHDAFVSSLQTLEDRDRTVLRLHLVDGLNIEAIGALYDVHRATVARWLAASRELLFEGTRAHLNRELGLSETEFKSLVRLVRSQLDVSICRILEEDAAAR